MSRTFDGTDDNLEIASAVINAFPTTFAARFNSTSATTQQAIMVIENGDTGDNWWILEAAGHVGGDPVRAQCHGTPGGAEVFATTSSGYSTSTWHHACGVFASASSWAAYIDGGSVGTNATSRDPSGTGSRTQIGAFRVGGSYFSPFTGQIAEAAIWNVALTAAEVLSLSKGVCPLLVRPNNVVAYWPIVGRVSTERERVGNFHLTVTGATQSAHPPKVFYPDGAYMAAPVVAAPAGGNRRRRMLVGSV